MIIGVSGSVGSGKTTIADVGGSGTTFEGFTTINYSAKLGGIAGANTKCQIDYSGSHMCTSDEVIQSGAISFSSDGWIYSNYDYDYGSCQGYDVEHIIHDFTYKDIYTLDSTDNIGYYTSIVISGNGYPFISYYDQTNNALKGFACYDELCNSGTNLHLLTYDDPGRYTSMVVNGEGEPIISFYEEQYDYLEIFRCSSSSCSSGSERILDSSTSVGYYTSIALGNDTFPVISYYDQTNGDLKLVKCTSDDCLTSKTAITLDSTGNVGSYSSIAIGSDGYPAISYYDSTNYDLKFYKCDDHNCTTEVPLLQSTSSHLYNFNE